LIVETVMDAVDKNRDGRITLSEFEAVGLDALPSFESLGAEGHHYDVESGAHRLLFHCSFSSSLFRQSFSSTTKVRVI